MGVDPPIYPSVNPPTWNHIRTLPHKLLSHRPKIPPPLSTQQRVYTHPETPSKLNPASIHAVNRPPTSLSLIYFPSNCSANCSIFSRIVPNGRDGLCLLFLGPRKPYHVPLSDSSMNLVTNRTTSRDTSRINYANKMAVEEKMVASGVSLGQMSKRSPILTIFLVLNSSFFHLLTSSSSICLYYSVT